MPALDTSSGLWWLAAGVFWAAAPNASFAAEAPVPPEVEVIELETIIVQERREQELQRIEDESQRFQEELERIGRLERTQITDSRDNGGNGIVRVQTRWLTYCLEVPSLNRFKNELGEDFAVPVSCPYR